MYPQSVNPVDGLHDIVHIHIFVVLQIEGAGIKFPENKAAGVSLRSSRVCYT